MILETVKIVSPVSDENPLGYIVINASDLSDEHELFAESEGDGAEKAPAKVADGSAASGKKKAPAKVADGK